MKGHSVSSAAAEERRSEFFLAASHQLKSPVAIIQWCLQSVLERGELPAKEAELLHKASMQASSMGQLITDLLHMLRLESSQRQKGLERVEIAAVVNEVYSQYQSQAKARDIHLRKEPLPSGLAVLADPTYLKQAVINLVDNAIKYTKPGGEVAVTIRRRKEWVEIEVRDQGIGISDVEQAQLFHEFFRGQEARVVAHEGTGLGLVLVKHIAEEFGGTISISSEQGTGSIFTLRLPAA